MAKSIPVFSFVFSAYFLTQQQRSYGHSPSDLEREPRGRPSKPNLAQGVLSAARLAHGGYADLQWVAKLAKGLLTPTPPDLRPDATLEGEVVRSMINKAITAFVASELPLQVESGRREHAPVGGT